MEKTIWESHLEYVRDVVMPSMARQKTRAIRSNEADARAARAKSLRATTVLGKRRTLKMIAREMRLSVFTVHKYLKHPRYNKD